LLAVDVYAYVERMGHLTPPETLVFGVYQEGAIPGTR
jgi:hypothetical protein